MLTGLEEVADFQIIREWEKTTEFGDRAEIRTLPEGSQRVGQGGRPLGSLHRQKCPNFERCFITLMHQRAAESDIIIVNHHLFFADLSLRDERHEGGILPEYHAVVFDEAHEIEDVVGQYFGVSISNYRFQELRRDIAAIGRMKSSARPSWTASWNAWTRLQTHFFGLFGDADRRDRLPGPRQLPRGERGDLYRSAGGAGTDPARTSKLLKDPPDEDRAARAAARGSLPRALRFVMEERRRALRLLDGAARPGHFSAGHPHRSRLHPGRASVRPGGYRGAHLGHAGRGAAASITPQGRLGLENPRSLIVPGHFDYQKQALLYVPQHLPDPRDPAFSKAASEEVVES